MFRYWAMALESDFDEFGYTDASDIEVESEILEIGDDYEAPEPEFRRQVQAEFREVPPRSVPVSHPAVLAADTLPPPPRELEGLLGLPGKASSSTATATRSATAKSAARTAAASSKTISSAEPVAVTVSKPAATAGRPASGAIRRKTAGNAAPSSVTAKAKGKQAGEPASAATASALPRKHPAKEQIAPLAGNKSGAKQEAQRPHPKIRRANEKVNAKAVGTNVAQPAAPKAGPVRTASGKAKVTKPAKQSGQGSRVAGEPANKTRAASAKAAPAKAETTAGSRPKPGVKAAKVSGSPKSSAPGKGSAKPRGSASKSVASHERSHAAPTKAIATRQVQTKKQVTAAKPGKGVGAGKAAKGSGSKAARPTPKKR